MDYIRTKNTDIITEQYVDILKFQANEYWQEKPNTQECRMWWISTRKLGNQGGTQLRKLTRLLQDQLGGNDFCTERISVE